MQLALLEITNFRGVQKGRITFSTHTVLVGANNCGKTTVIEALALLFGRDRMVRMLTEYDFYGGDPKPVDRIKLVATIHRFDGDDPGLHPEWFREDRAVPKWWNPSDATVHADRNHATWRLCCQIAFAARFDATTLEVETARYFQDDEDDTDVFQEGVWTQVPVSLIRQLGLFLVPANRSWDRVMSFGSDLFRRVVTSGDGLPAEAVLHERDALRVPGSPLEEDARLNTLIGELNTELAGFFPSKPELHLRLTTTDSEGVLGAVVPHYTYGTDGVNVPARRHGSGLISMQWLLLLLQFGRRRAAAGQGFWIALEEPELHVPPALQRRIVHRLQALSTQTIVSTHSPTVAALSGSEALTMLRKVDGALSCNTLAGAVLVTAPNAVRKLFQLNRVETIGALMHDTVLVPEGRIDVDLVRLIGRAIDSQQTWTSESECRFEAHVGVVPTHDGSVVVTYQALSTVHPKVACLVDGDAAGVGYIAELTGLQPAPYVVLRWPDGWAIEDVIGWILRADAVPVLAALGASIQPPVTTVDDLVARLKVKGGQGLKGDLVAYEAIAAALANSALCIARARELLNAIADVLLGQPTPRFVAAPGNALIKVLVL
ncbi:MAG: ATP-dependent nuclease [Steroidobacteraceae bacterium]